MEVIGEAEFTAAVARAKELGEREGSEAAREFIAGCQGSPALISQLRPAALATLRDDRPSLLEAEAAWRELEPDSSELAFQLASTIQNLVELRAREEDKVAVVEQEGTHLQEARLLYERAGRDKEAQPLLRKQSWVNLANAFDFMGRDIDALRCYRQAIGLDPDFGMALGNYGMTLLGIAPFMAGHQNHVLADAATALDRALEDEERVTQLGGPAAVATFRSERERIQGPDPHEGEAADHSGPNFGDPHLRWAYRHGLLLHISPECLGEGDQIVDPLHLGTMTIGIDEAAQARLKRLQDAFNAVKQDYVAARYSLWLASEPESPIREQAQELSARGRFVDTLGYARWGLQTGIALGALNVATNTLDKIAGLTHLYFETGRSPSGIYFNGMWRVKPKKGEPSRMQAEFKAELEGKGNRGLLALCDLSLDVIGRQRDTELKKLVALRNTATHRFLVAHDMVIEDDEEDGWIERLEWSRILEAGVRQLAVTRAALLYLARAIAGREANNPPRGQVMPLRNWDVEDFDSTY
jgi:tetratricopeptide (TPR) repeat protein